LIAGISSELLVGVATGGASRYGRLGKAALAFDTAGNAVGAGRGVADAYQNGLGYGNVLQIVGGAAGLGGNVAAGGRQLGEMLSDAGRVRVSFDATTFSTGGLGGAKFHLAPNKLQAGQAGSFSDLDARAIVGDNLTPHHMPQAALGFTSRAAGGAIMLPQSQHVLTRTYGFGGAQLAATEAATSFRTVLARDIRDLRGIAGRTYNPGIQDLLGYYRQQFPGLITKSR
jgi:hypothetical protein